MAPAQKLGRNLLCPGGKMGKKRGKGERKGGKGGRRAIVVFYFRRDVCLLSSALFCAVIVYYCSEVLNA